MAAMAQDNDAPSLVSDIATRLGRVQTAVSAARHSLIHAGLIYAHAAAISPSPFLGWRITSAGLGVSLVTRFRSQRSCR
ncbi:hypothetical protein ABIB17_000235 [Arthrobacter sp. UYEF6]